MIVIGGLIIGAAFGAFKAKKRGGSAADILQYAAVYGIIFGLLGMMATIITHRMAL